MVYYDNCRGPGLIKEEQRQRYFDMDNIETYVYGGGIVGFIIAIAISMMESERIKGIGNRIIGAMVAYGKGIIIGTLVGMVVLSLRILWDWQKTKSANQLIAQKIKV